MQNNEYYRILKNTSSEADSSSWKMWLGENHKRSRSLKRLKRLQYRGDISARSKEREATLCLRSLHLIKYLTKLFRGNFVGHIL